MVQTTPFNYLIVTLLRLSPLRLRNYRKHLQFNFHKRILVIVYYILNWLYYFIMLHLTSY